MATLRNKRKLAAVPRETPETTRNTQSRNTIATEMAQRFIFQVSEEVEGRVTEKLSKDFSRTELRFLVALSKLYELLLNPQNRTCSVAVPGASTNDDSKSRGPTGDRFSNGPCPEVVFSSHHSGYPNGSEMEKSPHMGTRGQEEIRNRHHVVIRFQEEIPYCSTGSPTREQKKARSTCQPQFRSENTPAILEGDQILLALQQLATNSNSANFNENINRISKLPKSLTTTMSTFDGKSDKFKLFEDLFQTSLRNHNSLTEENKINYLHTLMSGNALQTCKNITSPNREKLGDILTVFHRKNVKPQSMTTANPKFQRMVFNPAN